MRRLVFDQSSPVHPVSESRGGTLSVTKDERTEILVSNFGFNFTVKKSHFKFKVILYWKKSNFTLEEIQFHTGKKFNFTLKKSNVKFLEI